MDFAIVVAVAGAAGAGLSAAAALWTSRENRIDLARQIEDVFRRSRDAAPAKPSFDVFLAYAADDSKKFARGLAKALSNRGVRVWFDEDQIQVGDNAFLRIGEGLNASRFGLVILSPHFFERNWAEQELRAMLQRESEDRAVVLPIWHGVSLDEVQRFAPELAMKRALSSDEDSLEEIAANLAAVTSSPDRRNTSAHD